MNRETLENLAWRTAGGCADKSCVEVAMDEGNVYVRDSKDRTKPPHIYTRPEWYAFLAGAKRGEFDLPAALG